MFEQHLISEEASVPVKQEPGDLFYNYEVGRWDLGPRIYKILAASAVFNVLFLVTIAQADILTMRGCDSPFVGRVCQVLDTVYVGTVLFGTEREYVDVEYDRIDLGEADITMIDVSNMEAPLSYPEGYFQIANPEQFAQMQAMANDPNMGFIPGITPMPSSPDMLNTRPVLPSPNRNAVKGDLPDSLFEIEGEDSPATASNSRKGRRGGRPIGADTNSDQQTADANSNTNANSDTPKADPTQAIAGVEINKRPMVDLGNYVLEEREKGLNLESEFMIAARGKLDKTGKLDRTSFRYVNATSSDEKMIEVVKESIEAINVAGYLKYLEQLSGKDIELLFQQDAENISAMVQSEMESPERAQAVKTWLQIGLDWTKSKKEDPNASQDDKDDLELLRNARVEVQGKKVVINFSVPKTVAHPMIQRKLTELAAENQQRPNGNAVFNRTDKTAVK